MPKISLSIIGTIALAVVVGGGAYLYFAGSIPANEKEQAQTEEVQEILSIAGRVTSINVDENSFIVLQPKEEREFVVLVGEETEFIRLVFPFDLNNPPTEGSFTPEREVVTVKDVQVNDQVFIRASSPVTTGQDIVSPLEIQILP
ncbi:MAG: hypothetical protein O3C23_02330 [bacterium]|nr:hypothetical protein [bacterium]